MNFLGVDIETTGTDPTVHSLIQIGVARGAGSLWVSDVGHQFCTIDPRASEVHGFSAERIMAGPGANSVDEALFAWLGAGEIKPLIAVGWNVGTFDFPFIRQCLPLTASLFSYRFVDLNAICFALGNHKSWKKAAKRAAARMIGGREAWHDAGYDAQASIAAFFWLQDRLQDVRPRFA